MNNTEIFNFFEASARFDGYSYEDYKIIKRNFVKDLEDGLGGFLLKIKNNIGEVIYKVIFEDKWYKWKGFSIIRFGDSLLVNTKREQYCWNISLFSRLILHYNG